MAIPNLKNEIHHIGEAKQEFRAGIRSEDFPHIANLLINLYSDPILAVMREYSTNALDAHIAAGNPDPILVTLPTSDNLEFVVQDYGIGLSVDDLENIYSMYGRSTKRDSNDVVGQLGLGCKSGLTYADAFTITAVKNGVKVVAMSTKDEHGVGVIKVIDTASTDERNGVRIAVPVGRYDVRDFEHKAEQLYSFWEEGTVLVNGEAPEIPEWRKVGLWLDDDVCAIPADAGIYRSKIIMGNVTYDVPDAEYGTYPNKRTRRFIARVNMGDIDFVPSREAVHMTQHTKATLAALSEYIGEHFDRVLGDRLAKCATRWDETLLKVLWKGSSMAIRANADMPIWNYNPSNYGRQAQAKSSIQMSHLTSQSTVIVTHFPNRNLATANRERLREMFPNIKHFVVIPTCCDVSGLSGRDGVVTWDAVLESTKKDAKAKAKVKREKRDETLYYTNHGNLTAAQIDALDGVKMYLTPGSYSKYGDFDGTVVRMYSIRQKDRLIRLIDGIVDYNDVLEAKRAQASAAITERDMLIQVARSRMGRTLSRLDPDLIDDPELAEAIRMARMPEPATIREAMRLHAPFTITDEHDEKFDRFNKLYPLASNHYLDRHHDPEMVFYINGKYAAMQAAAAAVVNENQIVLDFAAA